MEAIFNKVRSGFPATAEDFLLDPEWTDECNSYEEELAATEEWRTEIRRVAEQAARAAGYEIDPDGIWLDEYLSIAEAELAESDLRRERQERERRESDDRLKQIRRRLESAQALLRRVNRGRAEAILSQRPTRLVLPRPREGGPAPIRRQGSRRTTAPTRAEPEDDPDGEGEHDQLVGRGTAVER